MKFLINKSLITEIFAISLAYLNKLSHSILPIIRSTPLHLK